MSIVELGIVEAERIPEVGAGRKGRFDSFKALVRLYNRRP
jgi:hypothetical protein